MAAKETGRRPSASRPQLISTQDELHRKVTARARATAPRWERGRGSAIAPPDRHASNRAGLSPRGFSPVRCWLAAAGRLWRSDRAPETGRNPSHPSTDRARLAIPGPQPPQAVAVLGDTEELDEALGDQGPDDSGEHDHRRMGNDGGHHVSGDNPARAPPGRPA